MGSIYKQLEEKMSQASLLGSTASVLGWDQETYMPKAGVAYRGKQLAQLAGMVHEMTTAPEVGELLEQASQLPVMREQPCCTQAVNVRQWQRAYEKATRLPTSLVQRLAETESKAKADWQKARAENNYRLFQPALQNLVDLLREKADALLPVTPTDQSGSALERWDALADLYEPKMKASEIDKLFKPLKQSLSDLIATLKQRKQSNQGPTDQLMKTPLPIAQQRQFVEMVAKEIGFDFDRGRLDLAAHPFCSGFHPDDVRLTTRFSEGNLPDALGSTMHEAGHGMYEQGLLREHRNTPAGMAASLAVHESQSRLWENQVGRSQAFWRWAGPKARECFGPALSGFSDEDLYLGCNVVSPGLIRVEADEATYNLHIMIRFELERSMLSGDLSLNDLPAAWHDAYQQFLGVDVPSDADGCLQDIHWSMGALGYFPTYTLGTIYAAELFDAASFAITGLDDLMNQGEFAPLLTWLQEHVHAYGQTYDGVELVEKAIGRPVSSQTLLDYLTKKFTHVYGE